MRPIRESARFFKKRFHEWQHRKFFRLLDLPADGSVLDVSCGDGDMLSLMHFYFPALELHGIDMSQECIAGARTRCADATLSVARAESIPYPHARFNVALCCMSLHHYENPIEIFSEMSRVLRPGGKLHVIDLIPRSKITQALHNLDGCPDPYHFEKYYMRDEVQAMADQAGFNIVGGRIINFFSGTRLLSFMKNPESAEVV